MLNITGNTSLLFCISFLVNCIDQLTPLISAFQKHCYWLARFSYCAKSQCGTLDLGLWCYGKSAVWFINFALGSLYFISLAYYAFFPNKLWVGKPWSKKKNRVILRTYCWMYFHCQCPEITQHSNKIMLNGPHWYSQATSSKAVTTNQRAFLSVILPRRTVIFSLQLIPATGNSN